MGYDFKPGIKYIIEFFDGWGFWAFWTWQFISVIVGIYIISTVMPINEQTFMFRFGIIFMTTFLVWRFIREAWKRRSE